MGKDAFNKRAASFVKDAVNFKPVLPDIAEAGVNILDDGAKIFSEPYSPKVSQPIQEAEVLSAQKKWGEGIVEIGKLAGSPAEATAKAESVISTLYGYKTGPVLFKPTKAAAKPFRLDPTAALSYFVSGNTAFPEDKGFALKPWTGVRFENNGVLGGYDSARAGELLLHGYRRQGDQGGVHLRLLPRLRGPVAHQLAPLLLAFQASMRVNTR